MNGWVFEKVASGRRAPAGASVWGALTQLHSSTDLGVVKSPNNYLGFSLGWAVNHIWLPTALAGEVVTLPHF